MKRLVFQFGIFLITCLLSMGFMSYAQLSHVQSGNWTEITKLPIPGITFSVNEVDGKLYIIGGESNDPRMHDLSDVSIYDIETGEWTTGKPLPTARPLATKITIGQKIYAIGGNKTVLASGNQVEVYDVPTDTWTSVADLPTSRIFPAACVFDGKIYVIGGYSQSGIGTSWSGQGITVVERYDPVTDKWDSVAPMPNARFQMIASVLNGKIYTVGGDNSKATDFEATSMVEEYDPITDQWTTKMNMHYPRSDFASAVIDGRIYAFGGSPSGHVRSVYPHYEVYDPQTDIWTLCDSADFLPQGALGAIYIENKIYIVGGIQSTKPVKLLPEVYVYNVPIFTVKSDPPVFAETDSLVAEIHEDCKIYIVPVDTPAKLDSIINDSIVSFDATATQELKMPFSNLPLGTYKVYGVSLDGRVDLNPFLLRIVPDPDPPILEVLYDTVTLGDTIFVKSDKDGTIYLVPKGITPDIFDERPPQESSAVTAGNWVGFPTGDGGLYAIDYWLYAEDEYGFFSEAYRVSLVDSVVIGIASTTPVRINLYPNPANDLLNIQAIREGVYFINITTLNGQQILLGEMEGTSHQIDLSSFQKGIYLITIRSIDNVTTNKLIKL